MDIDIWQLVNENNLEEENNKQMKVYRSGEREYRMKERGREER